MWEHNAQPGSNRCFISPANQKSQADRGLILLGGAPNLRDKQHFVIKSLVLLLVVLITISKSQPRGKHVQVASFVQTTVKKPKTLFTVITDKEKQKLLTFTKQEPVNVAHLTISQIIKLSLHSFRTGQLSSHIQSLCYVSCAY